MKSIKTFSLFWFLAFIAVSSSISVLAQDDYYQDKNGAVPLWYHPDKIVMRHVEGGGVSVASLLSLDSAFDQSKEPELTLFGFYFVWLVEGSNVASVVARLDTNQAVDIINPIYLTSTQDTAEFVAFDRVAVKFSDSVSRASIDSMNQIWQVQIVDSIAWIPYYILRVTDTTENSVLEIANIYEQDTLTDYAIPDWLAQATLDYAPADSFFTYQYYLHNNGDTSGGEDVDIDALEAWEFGLGDTSLVIAIADMGVEAHEDMPANRFYGGYDFAGDTLFKDMPRDSDPSPGDGCVAHGMACAGIFAASHNSIGISGIAPDCKIMPLKVFDDLGNQGTFEDFRHCISYAAFYGASIMSNSWTFKSYRDTTNVFLKDLKQAIKEASQQMLIFHSAGNTHLYVAFPANMKEVISVGAVDRYDNHHFYSPHYSLGDSMDLVAPSGDILPQGDVWTMDINGNRGYNPVEICGSGPAEQTANLNYTTRFGGTSAACPQAAGVAALLMSYERNSFWRNMNLADFKDVLKNSADDIGAPGWDSLFGYGRLNAMKALVAIARGDINKDRMLTLVDIQLLVNHVFDFGPITPHVGLGDVNCNGSISIADIVYLVNFVLNKPGNWTPPICYKYNY